MLSFSSLFKNCRFCFFSKWDKGKRIKDKGVNFQATLNPFAFFLFFYPFLLSSLYASIHIIKPYDIIFTKIISALYFNQNQLFSFTIF